jgi:hypothetical protein
VAVHRDFPFLNPGELAGRQLLVEDRWPADVDPLQPRDRRDELRVLVEHGLTTTRSFFFWPDFMPERDRLDDRCVVSYQDFLDANRELGMGTVPTFLVGYVSGENFDRPWRGGRDLYTDIWLVAGQDWYVEKLTRQFAAHPAVVGWLIGNENLRQSVYNRGGHRLGDADGAGGAGRWWHLARCPSGTVRGVPRSPACPTVSRCGSWPR